jgi:hypothetical protein
MGIMTIGTILLHGRMLDLIGGNLLPHLLVASKTKSASRFLEIIFVWGRMRVMAFHTGPFGNGRMKAYRLFRDDAGMTFSAYLAGVRGQQFAMRGRMGTVTADALSFLHRRVHKRVLQFVLKGDMAFETVLAGRPGFQMELVLGMGG